MKQIVLKSMSLLNFKGIKSQHIDFDLETDIFGANGTGKTTVFDAFTWCLFGKDSSERKDFEVKTIDPKTGKVISEIDHEVKLEILINGDLISIKRVLKEKWTKKKGSEFPEFTGNVTELYWDEVPVNLTEFNKKVGDILNEQIFKMITSPTYFNSIDWKQRRRILTSIIGEISDTDIAEGNQAYQNLLSKLTNGKSINDYNSQLTASIKKAKEDLKAIPARLDEVFRGIPENKDFSSIENEIISLKKQYDEIDLKISDSNKDFEAKSAKVRAHKTEINDLEIKISNIESKARNEAQQRIKPDLTNLENIKSQLNTAKNTYNSYLNGIQSLSNEHTDLQNSVKTLEKKIEDKRTEWGNENSKEISFDDNSFHCPTCKREFESGDVEAKKQELTNSFNAAKKQRLNEISQEGISLSTKLEETKKNIVALKTRIENGNSELEKAKISVNELEKKLAEEENKISSDDAPDLDLVYQSILSLNSEYKDLKDKLESLKKVNIEEVTAADNSTLIQQKNTISSQLDSLKIQLNDKVLIENGNKRIEELKAEQTTLSQQIANVEKEQFVIENFIKDKIDRLEYAINSRFKYIKFRMFEEQINGGMRETCEATVNGVPYSDANSASKINAGLDVINTLSNFYGVYAPIFIDNAESVHTLIETQSQLIRLVVDESSKSLNVKSKELVA